MSKQIATFEDNKLNSQFREILDNLEPENFIANNPTIRRDDGTLMVLILTHYQLMMQVQTRLTITYNLILPFICGKEYLKKVK